MKYFILSIVLLISSDIHAQIGKSKKLFETTEVGRIERFFSDYPSLYTLDFVENKDGKRTYVLVFTNEETLYDNTPVDTKSLTFIATQKEFDYLFNFLVDGFKEDQNRYLEVGKEIIQTLPPIRKYLYIYVHYKDGSSASLRLRKKQLFKLFGKK